MVQKSILTLLGGIDTQIRRACTTNGSDCGSLRSHNLTLLVGFSMQFPVLNAWSVSFCVMKNGETSVLQVSVLKIQTVTR